MAGVTLQLLAARGRQLLCYDLDTGSPSQRLRAALSMPAAIQYAWPHPSRGILYVGSSDRRSGRDPGAEHHLAAVTIKARTGELGFLGPPVRLPHRPIHLSADRAGRFLLVAYNEPSYIQAYRLGDDGLIGGPAPRDGELDTGCYPHHVQATPTGGLAILVTRGIPAEGAHADVSRQQAPGALKAFAFHDGVLRNAASIALGDGFTFGPRDVAFHPTRPWMFVSLETQNKVVVFEHSADHVSPRPLFITDTLPAGLRGESRQLAGAIWVHPSGRFLYCANRGDAPAGLERAEPVNGLAVFAIDQDTGELRPIQHVSSEGRSPRTFTLDPSGQYLVVANSELHVGGPGDGTEPPNLALFRIGQDGRLTFVRKFEPPGEPAEKLFWVGHLRRRVG